MEDGQRSRRLAAYLLRWLHERAEVAEDDATPLDLLVDRLGIDVATFHPESRRKGTLGWLEPDEELVYLREGLPEAVRRFTLAHELGHALLHRSRPLPALGFAQSSMASTADDDAEDCGEVDLQAAGEGTSGGEELLRPGEVYSARARREGEANAFAAELLLPAGPFRAAYLAAVGSSEAATGHGHAIRSVAHTFGVSEEVALRRLASLLVPSEETEEPQTAPTAAADRVVGLDQWQEAAARSETPALVIAGPGTGKTSTLVGRVAYLVRERAVPAERILALTFSNKAAREMNDRLAALLMPVAVGDATAHPGFATPTLPTVATIHAFCGDLLRRYAPLAGLRPDFRLVTVTEGYLLLRELAAELDLKQYLSLAEPGFHFPALLSTISRAKDELAGPEEYAQAAADLRERAVSPEAQAEADRATEVALVYSLYQATLARRGDVDFGDVVRLAVMLLREHPEVLTEVRARHQQILVDEFQDINRAMGVLLRTLAGEDGALWAVGDADQAIYRFRGASPANLSRFASEYPNAQIHTLRRNYRSVAPILDAAAGIAGALLGARQGEPLEAVRPLPDAPAVSLATAEDSASELVGLAQAIRQRVSEGRTLTDQAVLCRTRKHAQQVATALNAEGVMALLSAPLLEQDLVKDVLGVFSLLADVSGSGLLRAGRIVDHTFSIADARAVLAEAREREQTPLAVLWAGVGNVKNLTSEGAKGLTALAEVLSALRVAPDLATALTRYVFGLTSLGGRLLAGVARGDEEAVAEAEQLAELLQLTRSYDDIRATSQVNIALWPGFFDYLRIVGRLRQEPGRGGGEAGQPQDAVRVLTVHASKGLEFPVVYLPGLAERRFPTQRRGESAPLPEALIERAAEENDTHLLEEACLFYVAVTRARDELVLSVAERYGRMKYKPSPFLMPIQHRLGTALRRVSWPLSRSELVPSTLLLDADSAAFANAAPVLADQPNGDGPISVRSSAVETYARCPRQYAYRYVYGLRTREVGLSTLRRSLHETLRTLERHAHDAARIVDASASADVAEPSIMPLPEALRLFDANWDATLASELRSLDGGAEAEPAEMSVSPFDSIYRRHGQGIVERVWRRLASNLDPEGVDIADALPPRRTAPADFERGVTVRVRGRDITVTLDRVESLAATADANTMQRRAGGTPTPAIFVRHRLGRSLSPQADLRALFYALAAEQLAGEARATLLHHNLSTDELVPVTLNSRQRARLTEELHDALDGIARADFTPRPEPGACESCPFLLICPA